MSLLSAGYSPFSALRNLLKIGLLLIGIFSIFALCCTCADDPSYADLVGLRAFEGQVMQFALAQLKSDPDVRKQYEKILADLSRKKEALYHACPGPE